MGLDVPEELIVLALVLFLLSVMLRRSFGSDTARPTRAARKVARARDYGLLREIATAPSEQAAAFVRERLASHGIRATTAPGPEGGPAGSLRVLVFAADAAAAADLLLSDSD
ncbi:MAG TPA: hypothetical protein VHW44_25635 [Pseudonocardiaceae bacterium]|jgi:hypothetical protein|nr:hypothetical protein [Pseudonocardiaceae bacterium]